jgi:hypothetical protein
MLGAEAAFSKIKLRDNLVVGQPLVKISIVCVRCKNHLAPSPSFCTDLYPLPLEPNVQPHMLRNVPFIPSRALQLCHIGSLFLPAIL